MNGWIKVCGSEDRALEQTINSRVTQKISGAEYAARDITYISLLKRPLVQGALQISDDRLEKLRRLCQLWEMDLQAPRITSHRKVIGPIIVGVKKLCYPFLRALLHESFQKQRDFNAAAINLLCELAQDSRKEKN